jgi:hypothetical protein
VVVTDAAVARVGSQINDLRHVTQVALEAGERVKIIDEVRIATGRHAGDWLRIEPPAGEFRWTRGEDLALPPELAPVAVPADAAPAAGIAAAGEALEALRDAGTAVTQAVAEFDARSAPEAPQPVEPPTGMGRLLAGWLPRGTNVFDRAAPPAPPPAVSAGANAAAGDELADIVRLTEVINGLAKRIGDRVREVAPALLAMPGCGELTAAKLVGEAAGVTRFKSEADLARVVFGRLHNDHQNRRKPSQPAAA